MKPKNRLTLDGVDISVLSTFAVTQPLLDLLSRNVPFFVARKSEPVDVLLLVIGLSVALPALVVLLELIVAAGRPSFRQSAHLVLLTALVTLILLPPLKRIGGLPGVAWVIVALLLGSVLSWAYLRFRTERFSLVFLSPAILIFPALFLFHSPVYKVILGANDSSGVYPKVDARAPIIMIIFDEFPVTSLMDENQNIDSNLYPNFVALSRSATWYRNATTVSDGTLNAVPAILDGRYPRNSLALLPNSVDHPRSLFTLLGGSYQFNVVENNTRLCPERLCGEDSQKVSLGERLRALFSDVGVLYAYIVVPSDLTSGLPDISQAWKDFRKGSQANPFLAYDRLTDWRDRRGVFRKFVESIQPSIHPRLHFLHILLPHAPWEYLSSGKRHTVQALTMRGAVGINDKGQDPTLWTGDAWAVTQAYQRHLLQVGLVDHLIGSLMSHLKKVGLYDPALIVITADHGASFLPNQSRRVPAPANYVDILAVPLLIKAPFQQKGKIDDRNVETIDILPTIADILKIDMPWEIDGRSTLDASIPEKVGKTTITEKRNLSFPSRIDKRETIARRLDMFGRAKEPDDLFKIGIHGELVGRRLSEIKLAGNEANLQYEIEGESYYRFIDLGAALVPAHLNGRIHRSPWTTFHPLNLVIAVNGTIRAVTESHLAGGEERFSAMVPESALKPGYNEVDLFATSKSSQISLVAMDRIGIREYQWGTFIHFTAGGNGKSYQVEGWGRAEQYFTWMNGKQARIVIPISAPTLGGTLSMRMCPYLAPGKLDSQRVTILVNQRKVGEWLITSPDLQERTVLLPQEVFTHRDHVVITVETPDAVSPDRIGSGKDRRELGIALAWLKLDRSS